MGAVSCSYLFTFGNTIFTTIGAIKPIVLKEKKIFNYTEMDSLCPSHEKKLPTHVWQVAELLLECRTLPQKLHEVMV